MLLRNQIGLHVSFSAELNTCHQKNRMGMSCRQQQDLSSLIKIIGFLIPQEFFPVSKNKAGLLLLLPDQRLTDEKQTAAKAGSIHLYLSVGFKVDKIENAASVSHAHGIVHHT